MTTFIPLNETTGIEVTGLKKIGGHHFYITTIIDGVRKEHIYTDNVEMKNHIVKTLENAYLKAFLSVDLTPITFKL